LQNSVFNFSVSFSRASGGGVVARGLNNLPKIAEGGSIVLGQVTINAEWVRGERVGLTHSVVVGGNGGAKSKNSKKILLENHPYF